MPVPLEKARAIALNILDHLERIPKDTPREEVAALIADIIVQSTTQPIKG